MFEFGNNPLLQYEAHSRCAVEDIQSSTAVNMNATRIMNEATVNLTRQIEVLRKEMNAFRV